MTGPGRSAAWVLALVATTGCQAAPQAGPANEPHDSQATAPSGLTDGAVALVNLDAQLEGAEHALLRNPDDAGARATAVGLLLARATFRGRLADLERAALLARAPTDPRDADALLLQASVHLALHRFALAEAALDAVDRLDPRGLTAPQRVTLLAATGRLAPALTAARALAAAAPSTEHLGTVAILRAQADDASAPALFDDARRAYRNVSPFPLAWLAFQEGVAREALGDGDGARAAYQRAARLVPGYPAAIAHRAALEADPSVAIALLEPLTRSSDDPEYAAQLASLFAVTRRGAEAAALRAQARVRYEALLARAPEAFADHAARFFLEVGETGRALELARRNAALRPTREAQELLRRASFAADRAVVAR